MVVAAFMGLGLGPSVATTTKTKVVYDYAHARVAPRSITFACGSGDVWATKLPWGFWWKRRAFARGRIHYNDCNPTCSQGTI